MINPIDIRGCRIGEGLPKIAVPLVGETRDEIVSQAISAAKSGADILEWRVDYSSVWRDTRDLSKPFNEITSEIAWETGTIPMMFTFRTSSDGGNCNVDDSFYKNVLQAVKNCPNIDIVDIQLSNLLKAQSLGTSYSFVSLISQLKNQHKTILISSHDFGGTPNRQEIHDILNSEYIFGADIIKIACKAVHENDTSTLISLPRKICTNLYHTPYISIGMGDLGVRSRIDCGSITFGCLPGAASAPGQMEVPELRKALEEFWGSDEK